MSGGSLTIRMARPRAGDGEARRKAGLMECRDALLLLLLSGGQRQANTRWSEQPEGGDPAEDMVALDVSGSRGLVLGVPGGQRPFKSEE